MVTLCHHTQLPSLCSGGSSARNVDNDQFLLLGPPCLDHCPLRRLLSLPPALISPCCFSTASLVTQFSTPVRLPFTNQVLTPSFLTNPQSPRDSQLGFSISGHPLASLNSLLKVQFWEATSIGFSSLNFYLLEHLAQWDVARALGMSACQTMRDAGRDL